MKIIFYVIGFGCFQKFVSCNSNGDTPTLDLGSCVDIRCLPWGSVA